MIVFEHRKCFGGYRVLIGSPEGVPDSPGRYLGLMGQKGNSTLAHKGLVRPYSGRPYEEEKERGEGK